MKIEIQKSVLSLNELEQFLIATDSEFERSLSIRVGNLGVYAKKLYNNSVIITATVDNVLAGLAATYMNDTTCHCAFLTQIVVAKKYRRKNIGWQLLNYTIGLAAKSGMKTIKLEVDKSATPARELYKKFGFREDSESDVSVIMTKPLC